MSKESTTTKSRRETFKDLMLAIFILLTSFLPYVHDFDVFKGMKGFSGFSSLRIGLWAVSLFVVALSGWIIAFYNSKGKSYRFIILAPIFMLSFQLAVYLLDFRNTTSNEFSTKIILNIAFAILLLAIYFTNKWKK